MNVLLVDDQPSVIASLITCIPWHDLGISSVLTAGSAREARRMMENHTVDILVSDIEMPGEDGLDLLTWVRDQNMDMECIFLTAHADFFYAKRAISLRVSDYIIQPARDEDVIRAVRKAVANRQASHHRDDLIRYHGQDFAVKNVAAQSIFDNWPTSQESAMEPERLEAQLRRLSGFRLKCAPDDECVLLYGHVRKWRKIPLSPPAMLTKYRQLLDSAAQKKPLTHITWFPRESFFFTVIFTPLTEWMHQMLRQVYDAMEPQIGCTLRLFYCGADMKHIRESMASMQDEEIQFGYDHETNDICFRQVYPKRSAWESDPLSERNTQQMEKIRKFIRDHMAEPITRTQIAEALYLSPSYVSRVIKELEDCSCKELITRMKMEYAQKMLRGSKLPIGDIAIRCGYDSFAYFSKVYKATFEITPSMERDGGGGPHGNFPPGKP